METWICKLNAVNEHVDSMSRVLTETLVPGLDSMRPGVPAISKGIAVATKNITAVLNEQQTARRKFARLCQENVTFQQVADLDVEFKNLVMFAGDIAACTKSISERMASANAVKVQIERHSSDISNVVKTVTDASVAVTTDHSTAKFNEILGKVGARVHLSTTAITDAIKGVGIANEILTTQARTELIGVSKVALTLGL